jgi:hypothetical protein
MAESEATPRGGMSRRDLIRASAIAGAAAWTAPVIIDSLSSPAAAGSGGVPVGCSWFYVLYKRAGSDVVYWTSADDSSALCGNAQPANNSGARVKTCNGVTYTLPDGTHPVPTYDSGSGATPATADPNCATYISINGTTLLAIGDATILAAFSHPGGGSVCSPCPATTANNSIAVCGASQCDPA